MNTFKHIYILLLRLKRSNYVYIMKNNIVIQSQHLSVTTVGSLRTLSKAGKLRIKHEDNHTVGKSAGSNTVGNILVCVGQSIRYWNFIS